MLQQPSNHRMANSQCTVLRMRVSVCCKAARPTNQSMTCICAEAWPSIALWLQSKSQSHLENREGSEACPRSKVSPPLAADPERRKPRRIEVPHLAHRVHFSPAPNEQFPPSVDFALSSFTDGIRHRYASLMFLKSWPQAALHRACDKP